MLKRIVEEKCFSPILPIIQVIFQNKLHKYKGIAVNNMNFKIKSAFSVLVFILSLMTSHQAVAADVRIASSSNANASRSPQEQLARNKEIAADKQNKSTDNNDIYSDDEDEEDSDLYTPDMMEPPVKNKKRVIESPSSKYLGSFNNTGTRQPVEENDGKDKPELKIPSVSQKKRGQYCTDYPHLCARETQTNNKKFCSQVPNPKNTVCAEKKDDREKIAEKYCKENPLECQKYQKKESYSTTTAFP